MRLVPAALVFAAVLGLLPASAARPLPQPNLGEHTFDGPDGFGVVSGIAASGNIYVTGRFSNVDGQLHRGIARFRPDGTLDPWAGSLPDGGTLLVSAVAEDAAGNVAVAILPNCHATGARIIYIPAATQVGEILDTDAVSGRVFARLAFGPDGSLYAGLSPACPPVTFPQDFENDFRHRAEVIKYSGGTRDLGFALPPLPPATERDPAGVPIGLVASLIHDLLVDGTQLYVAGRFGTGGLVRATTSGHIQANYAPLPDSSVYRIALGPSGTLFAAGRFGPYPHGLVRLVPVTDTHVRDTSWVVDIPPATYTATLAVDTVGGHVYADDHAFAIATASRVAGWDPGPHLRIFSGSSSYTAPAPIRHAQVVGGQLIVGGDFEYIGGLARRALAALPLATAPVTWPIAQVSTHVLDFGHTFVSQPRTRSFTLTNTGGATMTISSLFAQGLTLSHDCPAALPAGATCTVSVSQVMAADAEDRLIGIGIDPRKVLVYSDAAGYPPVVALDTSTVNAFGFSEGQDGAFPPTRVGTSRTLVRTLENRSPTPLALEGLRIVPGSDSRFSQVNDCPSILPVAGTCRVTITFAPHAVSAYTAGLRVAADRSGQNNLYLSGVSYVDPFVSTSAFVAQQYRDLLGREGAPGEIAFWVPRLDAGTISRAQMALQLMSTTEFEGALAPLIRLYRAYFLRIPDQAGLSFWVSHFRAGNGLDGISNFFANSGEFTAMYGSLDNAQFVGRVYANVLGRAPDAGGAAFWLNELASGNRSRGQVMLGFSESAEYRGLTSNMVFVTMAYAGLLRRTPDATSFASWVGLLDAGNPREVMIQAILDSNEYGARILNQF